ncbi:MAG: ROK family glucokinase [Rhodoluna sp.]
MRVNFMFTVGIDIGGTKISGVLLDSHDEVLATEKVPTPAQSSEQILASVIEMVNNLSVGRQIASVGVAAAGFIDANRAEVIYAPNLSWRNEPLKENLEKALNLPVVIENDANAAGWAEFRFGAGQNSKNMVMITIGTGVGGAIIADGKLYRGGFGIGAELGHICFEPGGLECGCGQLGCLEQYASGTALLRKAKLLAKSGSDAGAYLRGIIDEPEALTGDMVYQAIRDSDPGTLALVEEVATDLGKALASIAAVLDPEIVVIGGGVSALGETILSPIRESFRENLPAAGFRPELKIVAANLANEAGAVGAADLARDLISQR